MISLPTVIGRSRQWGNHRMAVLMWIQQDEISIGRPTQMYRGENAGEQKTNMGDNQENCKGPTKVETSCY